MTYPTDEEFEYQRAVIRETFATLFAAVEDQLRYVDEQLDSMIPERPSRYDLAVVAHLARATKTALGIVRLCENGFGEMAMSSLRTLGELMVSVYWMSLDPEARATQFDEFNKLEALDTFKLIRELGWQDAPDVQVPDELRDDAWIAEVLAKYPNPVQGWMQEPMNNVVLGIAGCWGLEGTAERTEFLNTARILHLFGDRHSHVGAFDTARYLRGGPGQLTIQLGPAKRWVPQALLIAAWVYGQVFDLAAEHFGIRDLDSWRRRWKLLLARTGTVTREQARGVGRNDPCPCGSGFKFKRCHAELIGT